MSAFQLASRPSSQRAKNEANLAYYALFGKKKKKKELFLLIWKLNVSISVGWVLGVKFLHPHL